MSDHRDELVGKMAMVFLEQGVPVSGEQAHTVCHMILDRIVSPNTLDSAIKYHNKMKDSLTDSEDHRNHARNLVRYALGLPLGAVTGQIWPEHETFLAGTGADIGGHE